LWYAEKMNIFKLVEWWNEQQAKQAENPSRKPTALSIFNGSVDLPRSATLVRQQVKAGGVAEGITTHQNIAVSVRINEDGEIEVRVS
jgi:hypothetical protein